jgi:hypothetical protein
MTDPFTDQHQPWADLAAANPGWIERILEAHQPDERNCCKACTGQTQTSWIKHPCVLRFHAVEAMKARGNRPRHAA